MKINLTLFSFFTALLFGTLAHAGVSVYTGNAGERVFVEEAASLGKDAYLIKFEGVENPWAGKVIRTKRTLSSNGDRFIFDYDLELSSGIQKRQYALLVEDGVELIKGSRVKKMRLFLQGKKEGVEVNWDKDLTDKSQSIGLAAEAKKTPFKPDVD